MESVMPASVRIMEHSDLIQVLAWRNHPNVRRFMYTQHEITMEEHAGWFERASHDTKHQLLMFERGGTAQGFIHLHQIAAGGIADWGFYVAPDAPKGTGRKLGFSALTYAFTQLGLHKVYGQVLAFNEQSINFHNRLGFQQEGILREQHFDGEQYHSIICFGLLASEWQFNTER